MKSTKCVLCAYFWPHPPQRVSDATMSALKRDLDERKWWSLRPDFKHMSAVDVWTRHSDNQVRIGNSEWYKIHAGKFIRRWAALAAIFGAGAWHFSDTWWIEIPLGITCFIAVFEMAFFEFLRRHE